MLQPISLYFHIPFCKKKCFYCNFYSIVNINLYKEQFFDCLILELKTIQQYLKNFNIKSIYFGGGTPTLCIYNGIDKILNFIKKNDFTIDKNIEITIEANPESIEKNLIKYSSSIGINRISIGIQSFNDQILKKLGRIHDSKEAINSIFTCLENEITNISIDLMYELPYQTLDIWKNTIEKLKKLPISHISIYNLTIEKFTKFYNKKKEIKNLISNEKQCFKMLEFAKKKFENIGFKRYEISAFAKNEKKSIHNIGYWTGREFFGLGPSAFSYFKGKRFKNISNIKEYINFIQNNKTPVSFIEKLKNPDNINELIAIELRLIDGVNLKKYKIPQKTYENILKLQKQNLLEVNHHNLKLTEKGLLFYDDVAMAII